MSEAVSGSDVGRLVALFAGGGALLWFIVRNMVNYQKYFTTFYIEENVKLRNQVTEVRAEIDALRDEYRKDLNEAQAQIADLRKQLLAKDDEVYDLKTESRRLKGENERLKTEVTRLREIVDNAGLS